jgi:hypothetical protein
LFETESDCASDGDRIFDAVIVNWMCGRTIFTVRKQHNHVIMSTKIATEQSIDVQHAKAKNNTQKNKQQFT